MTQPALSFDDGCIELDNSTVERSTRPIKLGRKNALFAGSDGGVEHWAVIASLIETCKINDIDPLAYLTDVLTSIVVGHPNRDIDQLLSLPYRTQALRAMARERRLHSLRHACHLSTASPKESADLGIQNNQGLPDRC